MKYVHLSLIFLSKILNFESLMSKEEYIKSITFISPRDVRKNRSDAVHIMKSCEAFSQQNIDVRLLTPQVKRKGNPKDMKSVFSLYNIDKSAFELVESPYSLLEQDDGNVHPVKLLLFKLLFIFQYFIANRKNYRDNRNVIYSKCFISTVPVIFLKKMGIIKSPIVFEIINIKNSLLHRFLVRNVDFFISHSHFVNYFILKITKRHLSDFYNPPLFTQVQAFEKLAKNDKVTMRQKLSIPLDRKIVLYAGKVFKGSREIHYISEVAQNTTCIDYYIVGASPDAFEYYQSKFKDYNNIYLFGFQTLENYYKYVKAADLLLSYYPATEHYMYQLSPGKMGIYLASENPVILSDMPSLRLMFSDDLVYFIEPDNLGILEKKILEIFENYHSSSEKSKTIKKFISNMTYQNYGKNVILAIERQFCKTVPD